MIPSSETPAPIRRAREKTRDARERLQVAGGEIHLSNSMLEKHLPESHKRGEVRRAIDQTSDAARKVLHANQDLKEVEGLLEHEVAERERLERELRRRPPA